MMTKPALMSLVIAVGALSMPAMRLHAADLGPDELRAPPRKICVYFVNVDPGTSTCITAGTYPVFNLQVDGDTQVGAPEFAAKTNEQLRRSIVETGGTDAKSIAERTAMINELRRREVAESATNTVNTILESNTVRDAEAQMSDATRSAVRESLQSEDTAAGKYRALTFLADKLLRSGDRASSDALYQLIQFYHAWASPDDPSWALSGGSTTHQTATEAIQYLNANDPSLNIQSIAGRPSGSGAPIIPINPVQQGSGDAQTFRITITTQPGPLILPLQFDVADPDGSSSGTASPIQALPQADPKAASTPPVSAIPGNVATDTSLVGFNIKASQAVLTGTSASMPLDRLTARLQTGDEPSLPNSGEPRPTKDPGSGRDPVQVTTGPSGVGTGKFPADWEYKPPGSFAEAIRRLGTGKSIAGAGLLASPAVTYVHEKPTSFLMSPRISRYDGGFVRIADQTSWGDLAVGVPKDVRLGNQSFLIGDQMWGRISVAQAWDSPFNCHTHFAVRFGENYGQDFGGSEQPVIPGRDFAGLPPAEAIPTATLVLR